MFKKGELDDSSINVELGFETQIPSKNSVALKKQPDIPNQDEQPSIQRLCSM